MSKKLVLFYGAALCLLLNFIIPPFQNPDEPQHFRDVLVYALGEDHAPEVEERLIEQMDRYDWWRKAGMGRPAVLPRRFADIPFLHLPGSATVAGQPVLYHAAAGRLLRLVPAGDILTLYYICRLFSAVYILRQPPSSGRGVLARRAELSMGRRGWASFSYFSCPNSRCFP